MKRIPKELPRKIHFSKNEIWSYRIGKVGVIIRTPACDKTIYIQVDKLLGISFCDITYSWDRRRQRWTVMVRPSHVRKYIENNLRVANVSR